MIHSETTVETLVASNQYNVFLVDAAGVLYNQAGKLLPGVSDVMRMMQLKGDVFLMTNNSWKSLSSIERWCRNNDIEISSDRILSSGLGVEYDQEVRSKLENRKVYVVGGDSSKEYLENLSYEEVSSPESADVWLLMAWPPDNKSGLYKTLLSVGKENLAIDIVCCNPDIHIYIDDHYMPVVGYWAKKIGDELGREVLWMGKPYRNFSMVVKNYLKEKHGLELGEKCIFFDDNPENVSGAKRHLGITSCLIKDTGLSNAITISSIKKHPDYDIDWIVPSLASV